MNTPFDGKTWTLGLKNAEEERHEHTHAASNEPEIESPPLLVGAKFCVNIKDEDTVEIVFTENTPERFKTIWYEAENVYYDRHFYAVRGDLNFDRHHGEPDSHFGAHFLLCYKGRKLFKGAGTQVDIELFASESSISVPTATLITHRDSDIDHGPHGGHDNILHVAQTTTQANAQGAANFGILNHTPSHKGGWKADD